VVHPTVLDSREARLLCLDSPGHCLFRKQQLADFVGGLDGFSAGRRRICVKPAFLFISFALDS
jgi:hypothetical protein